MPEHGDGEGILRSSLGNSRGGFKSGSWEDGVLNEDNRSRRRRLAPIAFLCAAGFVAAACSSSSGSGATGTSGMNSPPPDTVQLSITPASGSSDADPAKGYAACAAG